MAKASSKPIAAGAKTRQRCERCYEAWKADAKNKIAEGMADARQGRVRAIDQVFAELEAEESMLDSLVERG